MGLATTQSSEGPPRHARDTVDDAQPVGIADELEALKPGLEIGRYRLVERIGQGTMGVVFAALDSELDRDIALKILRVNDVRARPRLRREAQALARLNHPAVVGVHDVGDWEDRVWLAMELVDGVDLARWLSDEPHHWSDIVDIFVQAGEGLAAVHAEGLVHRDFKPSNLMVSHSRQAKVLDFGLARAGDDGPGTSVAESTDRRRAYSDDVLTRPGSHPGTPAYMAPERYLGIADARTDQFSFCATLWEALYGELPFAGDSVMSIREAIRTADLHVASGSRIPPWLRAACARGLCARPQARWPTMRALLDHLRRAPVRRRRTKQAAGAALAFAFGVLATAYGYASPEQQRCGDGQAHIADVWNEDVRTRLDVNLAQAAAPFAATVGPATVQALEDRATAWVSEYEATCAAAEIHRSISVVATEQRLACLAARKADLAGAVAAFDTSDAQVVRHAEDIIVAIPSARDCALTEGPPPPSASQISEAQAIHSQLARARVARVAGQYEQARRIAQASDRRAAALGYGPLQTLTLLERGRMLAANAEYASAETSLASALQSALRWDQSAAALSASVQLATVVGVDLGRHDAGLAYLDSARGLWSKLGETADGRALLSNAIAAIRRSQGRLKDALAGYDDALRAWSSTHGPDDPRVLSAQHNLATMHQQLGHRQEAEAVHRTVLKRKIAVRGERHPSVAATRANLGAVLDDQGRYHEAVEQYRTAIEIDREALGEAHPQVALLRNNLAAALLQLDDLDGAVRQFEAALALLEENDGHQRSRASTRVNLAMVLRRQGRYAEALRWQRQAYAQLKDAVGEKHPNAARARYEVGKTLNLMGEYESARVELTPTLQALSRALDDSHVVVLMAHSELAVAQVGLGDAKGAIARVHDASQRASETLESAHPVRTHLAQQLTALRSAPRR